MSGSVERIAFNDERAATEPERLGESSGLALTEEKGNQDPPRYEQHEHQPLPPKPVLTLVRVLVGPKAMNPQPRIAGIATKFL
jgi:hypothetical protein